MPRKIVVLAALALLFPAGLRLRAQAAPAWDEKLRATADAAAIGEYMKRLTARPHHVGSAYDKDNAEWILARFREWGWDARIESYDVLFPTPKERLIELVAPTHFKALMEEPAIAGDPTSGQKAEQLPTYNVYSIDGDVTAPLVYVNYGRPEDYEELDRTGVSARGAIVIVRYGGSFRGTKPKIAAEHGAVGCIIYSDPRDDGYFNDDVFPNGPMRNAQGVERGSVQDLPVYSGDPLTPGIADASARIENDEPAPSLSQVVARGESCLTSADDHRFEAFGLSCHFRLPLLFRPTLGAAQRRAIARIDQRERAPAWSFLTTGRGVRRRRARTRKRSPRPGTRRRAS